MANKPVDSSKSSAKWGILSIVQNSVLAHNGNQIQEQTWNMNTLRDHLAHQRSCKQLNMFAHLVSDSIFLFFFYFSHLSRNYIFSSISTFHIFRVTSSFPLKSIFCSYRETPSYNSTPPTQTCWLYSLYLMGWMPLTRKLQSYLSAFEITNASTAHLG